MICSKECAEEYINHLACALRVVTDYPHDFSLLETSVGFSETADVIYQKLNNALGEGISSLRSLLSDLKMEISSQSDIQRHTKAFAMAIWLDLHTTYEPESDSHIISLHNILSISAEPETILASLNTNIEETCIVIFPCFPVATIYNLDESGNKHKHRRYNRNVLWGLNGKLNNCKYMKYRENISVFHLILSSGSAVTSRSYYRVAFVPFVNRADLIKTNPETMEIDGTLQNVIALSSLNDEELINQRFQNALDVIIQRDLHIDLLFGCEMLGTNEMYKKDEDGFIPFLESASQKAALQGSKLPELIILPSQWKNHSNFVWVANSNGVYLGTQNKYFAYRDEKSHFREALAPHSTYKILVIHVYKKHRIVIMICSDFLETEGSEIYRIIFEELNPSLIIVPTFTSGQYDFLQKAYSVSKYGASVVWGNYCGNKGSHDHIGAAHIVGNPSPVFMHPNTNCKDNCSSCQACLFYYDIPLEINPDRYKYSVPGSFTHITT